MLVSESQVSGRDRVVVLLLDDASLDMESGAVCRLSAVFTSVFFRLIPQTLPSAPTTPRNHEQPRVNNDGTPSQRLTYKRIYFLCAQKKKELEHNLNRTMIEATRLFDTIPFTRRRRVSCNRLYSRRGRVPPEALGLPHLCPNDLLELPFSDASSCI